MSLRVTDSYIADIMMRDANKTLARMLRMQRMASSLHRVNSYADDPVAVGAINRYRNLISTNQQYLRNTQHARSVVESTDSALQQVSGILADARVIVLQESGALANGDTNRQAGVQVDQLLGQLLNVLNTSVQGDYIFGGHQTDRPPFLQVSDSVHYQGDTGETQVQIGPHASLVVNSNGQPFMGGSSAVLAGNQNLAPRLDLATSLADLNLGAGWEAGVLRVTDGQGGQYTVDLSAATTVADVIDQIAIDSDGLLTGSLNAGGTGLQIDGPGPLTVSEGEGTHTARSLGLLGNSGIGVLVGADVRAAPTGATELAAIPGLEGGLPLGAVRLTIGETETVIDFSSAVTVGDLQALVAAAAPTHELRIVGSGLALVSGSSASFHFDSADETATASLLGLSGAGTPARLFGVLEDLKTALEAGDSGGILATLPELEAVAQTVLKELIKVGARENTLDWSEQFLNQRDEKLRSDLSQEWDADIAYVAAELTKAEAAYQATLMVTSRLFGTNLMQYLR